jgi:hypothetical protein
LPYFHNEALEPREGKLAFGIPYELLLGILCYGNPNVEKAADFFIALWKDSPNAVASYLSGFISRLADECDLGSPELKVKPSKRHTAMDFPRPSPALMTVWDFGRRLAREPDLHKELSRTPGAKWFFRQVPDLAAEP